MCTSTSVISSPGNHQCTLAFGFHTPSSIFVILKFKRAQLKLTVYGRKQANIHTHVYNAVTPVWGSLRLAPIILTSVLSSACITFDLPLNEY